MYPLKDENSNGQCHKGFIAGHMASRSIDHKDAQTFIIKFSLAQPFIIRIGRLVGP